MCPELLPLASVKPKHLALRIRLCVRLHLGRCQPGARLALCIFGGVLQVMHPSSGRRPSGSRSGLFFLFFFAIFLRTLNYFGHGFNPLFVPSQQSFQLCPFSVYRGFGF